MTSIPNTLTQHTSVDKLILSQAPNERVHTTFDKYQHRIQGNSNSDTEATPTQLQQTLSTHLLLALYAAAQQARGLNCHPRGGMYINIIGHLHLPNLPCCWAQIWGTGMGLGYGWGIGLPNQSGA